LIEGKIRDLSFDIRTIQSATIDDLDMILFQRVYLPSTLSPEIMRTYEQQLSSMHFSSVEDTPHPTILGILVIGKDPRRYIPSAYIQFLRVDGTELTDPIRSQKEIDGPLPEQLHLLDEILKANISVATDISTQAKEIRHPDYPIVALQQIARNAILHRTYEGTNAPVRIYWFSDRIEIQNPGGPFGQVNVQNFGNPGVTGYRNPHIAEAMKNLGYVQRFGMGIALARQQLGKNDNPPPEFKAESAHVLVTLRRKT
jgi:ATP-dependent DNA helicase RecG